MLDRHILKGYCSYMEIRVLKYFLAVAREGSITGAANSLHLTQKIRGYSFHIKRIELRK